MVKVSVIVPCYNGAVFLDNSIQSILAQTHTNLEIILINDGSIDNSLAIMQNYAKSDLRIRIINKEKNEGVDFARFSGIEIATGEYLTFLDADDWMDKNAIETLLSIALNQNVDIAYGNNVRVYSQKLGIKRISHVDEKYTERIIMGEEKEKLSVSFFGVNIVPVTLWGNLFKKSLFTNALQKTGLKFGEDLILSMQLYLFAKSIYITNQVVINYRWGGVTASYQPNIINDVKVLFNIKMEYIDKYGLYENKRTTVVELINCLASYVGQIAEYRPDDREKNLLEIKKEFQNPLYDCFEEYKDIPYFKDGDVNTACAHHDYLTAYSIAEKKSKLLKSTLRRCCKKICSTILKYIKI